MTYGFCRARSAGPGGVSARRARRGTEEGWGGAGTHVSLAAAEVHRLVVPGAPEHREDGRLPGGAVLLPMVTKLFPDLLPSSFQENTFDEDEEKAK